MKFELGDTVEVIYDGIAKLLNYAHGTVVRVCKPTITYCVAFGDRVYTFPEASLSVVKFAPRELMQEGHLNGESMGESVL